MHTSRHSAHHVLGLLLVLVSINGPAQDRVPDIARSARGGVALLTAYVNGKSMAATGFLVDTQVVITNAHVIKNAGAIVAEFDGGHKIDCRLIDSDDNVDLAALALETPLPARALAPRKELTVAQGEQVTMIGHPLGLKWTVVSGTVAAIRTLGEIATSLNLPAPNNPNQIAIQLNINSTFGMSGAPVLNAAGEVIGIQKEGWKDGSTGINFCIPFKSVEVLNLKRSPRRLSPEGERRTLNGDFQGVGLQRQRFASPQVTVANRVVDIGCQHWGYVPPDANFVFFTYVGDKQRFQQTIGPALPEILNRNPVVYVTNNAFGFSFLVPANHELSQTANSFPPSLEINLLNRDPNPLPPELKKLSIKAWQIARLNDASRLGDKVKELVTAHAKNVFNLNILPNPYAPFTPQHGPTDVVVWLQGTDPQPRVDATLPLARYHAIYGNAPAYNRAWSIYGAIAGETATITAYEFVPHTNMPGITPDSAERQFIAETLSFNLTNQFSAQQ